jgi:hypothetical protein
VFPYDPVQPESNISTRINIAKVVLIHDCVEASEKDFHGHDDILRHRSNEQWVESGTIQFVDGNPRDACTFSGARRGSHTTSEGSGYSLIYARGGTLKV